MIKENVFVHLRARSDYSLLRAICKPKDLVKLAKKNGMPALALTDINSMAGALEFADYAADSGVQPIVGLDLTIRHHAFVSSVLLLAKNQSGYHNLIKLSGMSSVSDVLLTDVLMHAGGLICIAGALIFDFENLNKSKLNVIEDLKRVFSDDLFIEVQRVHPNEKEKRLVEVAYQLNIPIVATNEVLFPSPDFREAHDVLMCIGQGHYINDVDREISLPDAYFRSSAEMYSLFDDLPEALENTILIAKKCHFMPEVRAPMLPKFECETSEAEELRALVEVGLAKRMNSDIPPEYKERMEYELGIIIKMNYAGYFLIVADFISWSKNNGVAVGPGRGSGVGSIVAWSLGITGLDPIKFALFFERFLNPVRVSMPDFDIDFCQERRHLVIDYIRRKYGHVAQIATFGTLQPRVALRDVGRVIQLPYSKVDKICKVIPHNPANPISLQEAIDLDKELQRERDEDEAIYKLLDISLKLEGTLRHSSTHAAGVVISDRAIEDYLPVYYDSDSDIPVTQYSMKWVEKAGLVKFDFLGLKTLTVINQASVLIRTKNPAFDIESIPTDDAQTFKMLSEGAAIGVFQLDNAYMCETLRRLHPDSLEDIIALISLNRPGPMVNIPTYIARKHGREKVDYPHPLLEKSLKETFGVVIYQEQVMEIAKLLAGYTLAEADILRRVMGKKIRSEMRQQNEKFIKGARENGIDEVKAHAIFEMVERFAGYGFNKSHAAAYALISYQTAYLKANYPIEFMVASLNLEIQNPDKLAILIQDAKSCGIQILSPDIRHSNALFSIAGNSIRYGIAALKNVGEAAARFIEMHRESFTTFSAFKSCIDTRIINRKALGGLIKSGAMDCFNIKRRNLFASVDDILSSGGKKNQISLFETDSLSPELEALPEWDLFEKTQYEFEALGLFLDNHPIIPYMRLLKLSLSQRAGVVTSIKIRSRGDRKFAVFYLSTSDDIYTLMCYDQDLLNNRRDLFTVGAVVLVTISKSDNGYICESIISIERFIIKRLAGKLAVQVHEKSQIDALKNVLLPGGNFEVVIVVLDGGSTTTIKLGDSFDLSVEKLLLIDGIKILER